MTTIVKRKLGAPVALVLACLVLLALPAGASAARSTAAGHRSQACDPTYGCTTTSTPHGVQVRCHFTITRGPVGTRVSVECTGVVAGTTVRIFFGNIQVASGPMVAGPASGVNGAAAAPAVAFDSAGTPRRAAQASAVSHLTFSVPSIAVGTYSGLISGQSFSNNLGPFQVTGTSAAGSGTVGTAGNAPSSSGSSLAHTGAMILLWVVVALAVILAGYVLYRRNRRLARR